MFHHHILTRGDEEIIKKVYLKQKDTHIKGDWFRTLVKDFEFIQEDMNEDVIKNTPREEYRKIIKRKVMAGAYKYYMEQKEKSKKKMKYLVYEEVQIQPYLNQNMFTLREKKLLFALRSHS